MLVDDRTLQVSLALFGNLLTSSNCSDVLELRAPGLGLAPVGSQFSSCSLVPADSRLIVTLAPGLSYRAGTTLNVKPQQNGLRFQGVAAYAPRTVPLTVLPSLVSAHLVDASTLRLTMAAAAPVLPANLTTAQCHSLISITNGFTEKPNAVASCSITNGFPTFTLATPFASGDSINLRPNQYHLRHANLTTGPAYLPAISAVPITPLPVSATQASPTTLHLLLPAPSTTPTGQLNPTDCNSAILLTYRNKSVDMTVPSPFSACAFSPDTTTLILTLASASNYLPGHYLSFAPNQNTLVIKSQGPSGSTVAYGSSVAVQVAPAFLATPVLLRSPTELQVVFAYRTLTFNANAAQCNAAVQLLSAEGVVKAEPFASCKVDSKVQIGSVLTLTLEPRNYTYAPGTQSMV